MTTILKQLLAKRGILSMEEQAADADKDKEQVGDGGSTPDGSEANPEEVTPTTPPEEVPPTEEVPSKEEEEEPGAEEAGAEEPGEAEPTPTEGEEPEPTPAEGGEQEPAPETPNPDEGGAEPAGEEEEGDDFDDEDDSDEDGDFDEDELDEAVEELTETQKADLAMINLIDKVRETLADGGLSGREATMVADRAGAILGKIEIEASPTPSMECFGSFGARRTNTELALEALQEDHKAVEQKKEGLIARLLAFLKEVISSLLSRKEKFERDSAKVARRTPVEGKQIHELPGSGSVVKISTVFGDNNRVVLSILARQLKLLPTTMRAVVEQLRRESDKDHGENFVQAFFDQKMPFNKIDELSKNWKEKLGPVKFEFVDGDIDALLESAKDLLEASNKCLAEIQPLGVTAIQHQNGEALTTAVKMFRGLGSYASTIPTLVMMLLLPVKGQKQN